ncbi:MAG TPA: hypothetical protein VM577_14375 [Anaerovoracaceae bacterium]|nr:hypothetical protein [Anaerovoracaceae bacterium]
MKQSYKMGWEAGYDVKHLYQNPYPKDSVEYKEYSQGWDRGRGYAWDSWGD